MPSIQWRLHSCFAPARAEGRAVQRLADALHAATAGELRVAVLPFGSSGIADPDLLGALAAGAIEAATVYAEYLNRDAPELALCYVQGVLAEAAAHWRAHPVVAEIYRATLARWGLVELCALARPVYQTCVFAPEPVSSLAALAGRTLRVWSRHQVESFARLGVSAEIVPQHAMVEALRSGRVGAALYMAEAAAATTGLAEVAPCFAALHPFSAIPNVVAIADSAWAALPPALQAAARAAGEAVAAETLADARRPREPVAPDGFTRVAPFPAAERAWFREAAMQAWAALAAAAGPAAVANRERVLAALGG